MYDMPPSFVRWGDNHLSMKWGFSQEAYDILASGEIQMLTLNVGDWSDLGWLTDFKSSLASLSISAKDVDWLSIGQLTELTKLSIDDFKIKFDFSKLQKLKYLKMYSRRGHGDSMFRLPNLETLIINGWKDDDVTAFSELSKLKFIGLYHTRVLKSLKGLEKLSKLEGLDIEVAPNLTNVNAIGSLPHLKLLRLANCKRIASFDCLEKNHELLSLVIGTCSDIQSLSILKGMTKLDYLSFGSGTKVVDGDLSILYDLKSLRHCRYTQARHYNIKKKDFDAHQFKKFGERSREFEEIWSLPII